MATLNKVFLVGHLVKSPECRFTAKGTAVGGFTLALNRHYRSQTGETMEEVCFVEIELIGALAEKFRFNLVKGSLVYVEGRLRLVEWRDRRTGATRQRIKVTADHLDLLST